MNLTNVENMGDDNRMFQLFVRFSEEIFYYHAENKLYFLHSVKNFV